MPSCCHQCCQIVVKRRDIATQKSLLLDMMRAFRLLVELPDERFASPLRTHGTILTPHKIQITTPQQAVVIVRLKKWQGLQSDCTRLQSPATLWQATRENAQRLAQLLHPEGVRRIALVSDAWHLPRATLEFRNAGFEVVAAPTRSPLPAGRPALEWLPSSDGLAASRSALREWLALRAAHWSRP